VTADGGIGGRGDGVPVRDVDALRVALDGSVTRTTAAGGWRVTFPPAPGAAGAANEYLADLDATFARPATIRSYGYDILRWLRFLAAIGVDVGEATRGDYSDFLRWLRVAGKTGGARRARSVPQRRRVNQHTGKIGPDEKQFGPATLAHSRIVLHEFYEFLLDRGRPPLISPIPHSRHREHGQLRQYPHHNPSEPFPTGRRAGHRRFDPPNPKGTPRHLSDAQYEQLWGQLVCDRDRALVKVAVDSGARPAELLGMTGADVGWGEALIHVHRKGGVHSQWIPVSRDAVVWLRRYQAASGYVAAGNEPVWVTVRGPRRAMGYEAYRAVFHRLNRRLGTNWTPHDLRHTACVRMLDAGMALHLVQEIMGHRDITATQKYLRPRLDELVDAYREALARPQPSPTGPGAYAPQDLNDLLGRP